MWAGGQAVSRHTDSQQQAVPAACPLPVHAAPMLLLQPSRRPLTTARPTQQLPHSATKTHAVPSAAHSRSPPTNQPVSRL
ncbi:hypothetical protein BC831DRAFT_465288, partial [Entophlyctis helioformis]